MNAQRRKEIQKVLDILADAQMEIGAILSDEEDVIHNTPESLQGSENYENSERTASNLAEAENNILEAVEQLNSAIE